MAILHYSDVPVARSIMQLIRAGSPLDLEFAQYIAYWSAFNSYYSALYRLSRFNNRPRVRCATGSGKRYTEKDMIWHAFCWFGHSLRIGIVDHPMPVTYFKDRRCMWNANPVLDAAGIHVNGVLSVRNAGRFNSRGLVDSYANRIDTAELARFCDVNYPDRSDAIVDHLSWQILNILYVIRCNIVHGEKMWSNGVGDELDVVRNALPILETIISSVIVP